MRENIFGAVENFFWQTGEARHVDAVTFVRATGDNFAQENDLLVPFAHRDVEIADAAAILRELGQFVVVRREQGTRFDLVMKKLGDAPGDGKPVECRCASS